MFKGSVFPLFSQLHKKKRLAAPVLAIMSLAGSVGVTSANATTTVSKVKLSQSGYMVMLVADKSKANRFRIKDYKLSLIPSVKFKIQDQGDSIALDSATGVGDLCSKVSANEIECTSQGNNFISKVSIHTGDQNDSVSVERADTDILAGYDPSGCRKIADEEDLPPGYFTTSWPVAFNLPLDVNAGPGNDYVNGGCGTDSLFGGAGADILIGANDLNGSSESAKDTLDCGADNDQYFKDSEDLVSNCESLWVPNINFF